jgi:hypothetical protein
MSKAGSYVCVCYKCKGNLITDYTASGIKLAGRQYRVLYGTREVDTALLIRRLAEKQSYRDCMKYRWQTKP